MTVPPESPPDAPDAPDAPAARHSVRYGSVGDAAALEALQAHLREPSPDLLRYGLTTSSVFVTDAGGVPVGYLLATGDPGNRHLAELVVHPDHRREGRARALLDAVCRASAGRVTLLVHPENDAAIALYDEFGFEIRRRRPDFYDGGDTDALLLARDAADYGSDSDSVSDSASASASASDSDSDSGSDSDSDAASSSRPS
ncbi:GNAT family N-acetyltransferase [Halobaculum sp. D14]|uniref:GNAT family N-acetyltransferase n=1 Tax=Halobaculum sp. D14 TaxID=3421642 RepID=UPI003EB7C42A